MGCSVKKNQLVDLFKNRLYKQLIELFPLEEISKSLSFNDGLRLAYHLLYNENWDDELQYCAVELLKQLRSRYQLEWDKSWKNDALLGMGFYITSQHEERYDCFKKSFDKCQEPPPGLLIELARCSVCPGTPPISYDKAIELVMQAISKIPYFDGINLLCNLYSLKNDNEKKLYWEKVLDALPENDKIHSPSIEPDFLVNELLQELKEKDMG